MDEQVAHSDVRVRIDDSSCRGEHPLGDVVVRFASNAMVGDLVDALRRASGDRSAEIGAVRLADGSTPSFDTALGSVRLRHGDVVHLLPPGDEPAIAEVAPAPSSWELVGPDRGQA